LWAGCQDVESLNWAVCGRPTENAHTKPWLSDAAGLVGTGETPLRFREG
jgi:hypothetical protein